MWWGILTGAGAYFAGFFFEDVTADWANDLVGTLLCWLQMAWCWLYSNVLGALYGVVEAALPVMPQWSINLLGMLVYFDAANQWVPLTEILVMALAWFPFYLVVRIFYMAQPWAGN